jgi:hypothetical protein
MDPQKKKILVVGGLVLGGGLAFWLFRRAASRRQIAKAKSAHAREMESRGCHVATPDEEMQFGLRPGAYVCPPTPKRGGRPKLSQAQLLTAHKQRFFRPGMGGHAPGHRGPSWLAGA